MRAIRTVRVLAHVVKQELAQSVKGDALHEARRNNPIGVDIVARHDNAAAGDLCDFFESHGKIEFGVWSLEFGVWSLEFGVWSFEFGWFDSELRTPNSELRRTPSVRASLGDVKHLARVGHVAGDGGGRDHERAHEECATRRAALPAFEVAIG